MTKTVTITQTECDQVENLFTKYQAYLAILGYLTSHEGIAEDNALYNNKWEEAVQLYIELEKVKAAIDNHYHPEGNWTSFTFNFNNSTIVYTNENIC